MPIYHACLSTIVTSMASVAAAAAQSDFGVHCNIGLKSFQESAGSITTKWVILKPYQSHRVAIYSLPRLRFVLCAKDP